MGTLFTVNYSKENKMSNSVKRVSVSGYSCDWEVLLATICDLVWFSFYTLEGENVQTL